MGVVADSPAELAAGRGAGAAVWAGAAAYAAVAALAAWRHEPWADEAHSWLLARDAGLFDLWTRLMHYEGSPGLWQSLLHVAVRCGAPYAAMQAVSVLCGSAAALLVMVRAPWPLAVRLALPFTFFLCYQYAVVARSYVLLPPLLFAAAVLYPERERRAGLLTAVLVLMAAVSLHGFILSAAAWVCGCRPGLFRRAHRGAAVAYFACMAAIAWSALPAADGTFVTALDTRFDHALQAGGNLLRGAFTGETLTSALAVALPLPFLRRGGGLAFFLLSAAALWAVASLIYSQVWHQGILLLAWLFALWISSQGRRATPPVPAALLLVIVPQCWWTVRSVGYDWNSAYSGSREAAEWLGRRNIQFSRVFAIGYACTALQPYFARNIFANVNGGAPFAYWDWSARNRSNYDSERLETLRPDYVLVGYKGEYEKNLWTRQVRGSGYVPVRHFEGNLFWKTAMLEPESYDLYRRGGAP